MKFKSNINCENCVATAKKTLDSLVGENNWSVDIADSDKILEIKSENIQPENIVKSLKRIGFKAEKII